MNLLVTTTTCIPVTATTTVEDVLNFTKTEIQTFLRLNRAKISGNKLTLAQRVVDTIRSQNDQSASSESEQLGSTDVPLVSCTDDVPSMSEMKSGWTGRSDFFPKVTINDIESYLLHSSHRTEDAGKMHCYRQYIRGLNFYKEGYIHKIMINEISDVSKLCYIRSKCFPSMQQGVYEQWLLVTKQEPFQVVKANYTCPAGCGEGCTHIAGLLFALEGRLSEDELSDLPCTSKPCQWNQPRKRKKDPRPITDISFKRVRYEDTLKVKKKRKLSNMM